jgi:hypothetical protein
MHIEGCAAAWESFRSPKYMERVKRGDAIFMFAKGVGIVGIGCAKAKRQILEPNDPDRIGMSNSKDEREWRIPVDWLDWRDDNDACPFKSPNMTFWNLTEDAALRGAVRRRFLGDA